MKKNSTSSFMHVATTAKSKLWKAVFFFLAMSAIGCAAAYAGVENCPDPASIQFDSATHQWKTTSPGWRGTFKIGNDNDVGELTLKLVMLKINHNEGDVVECAYDAANGENVFFSKGGSAKDSSGSIIRSEIRPVGEKEWNNPEVRDEFICQPSSNNKCAFDVVVPLPDDNSPQGASGILPVKLHFAPGTAFIAHACDKSEASGITCGGPFHANGTYYLSPNADKFCVEVHRLIRSWGQYYFQVDEGYAGDAMKWWGASVDPKFTLPKGIKFVKSNLSGNYTGCGLFNL